MTPISTCRQLCPTENEGSIESWNSVSLYSTVLCENTCCCYMMNNLKNGSLEMYVYEAFPSV
jgi:hypothetical protein